MAELNKHIVGIDLDKNELVRAVVHNSSSAPTSPKNGQIYYNTTSSKLFGFLGGVWVDLGNIYEHPAFSALSPSLGGANVLATFETNEEGHVIEATTRVLTLNDLGYTGDTDANNYLHPTFSGNDLGAALTGATVISDVTVNGEGHVTSFTTRELTPADIGAAVINDSVTSTASTWSSQKIQEELDIINSSIAGALVYKGGYNANTNTPNLDSSPTNIDQGFTYTVTTAGIFFTEEVQVGDMIIAEENNPTSIAGWTVVNKNIPDIVDATSTERGIIRIATEAEALAGTNNTAAITPATLVAFYNAQQSPSGLAANIGDGTAVSHDVAHTFNTKDVQVQLLLNATGETVYAKVLRTSTSNVRVLTNNPLASSEVRVLIKEI